MLRHAVGSSVARPFLLGLPLQENPEIGNAENRTEVCWAAVKEIYVSYYVEETLLYPLW